MKQTNKNQGLEYSFSLSYSDGNGSWGKKKTHEGLRCKLKNFLKREMILYFYISKTNDQKKLTSKEDCVTYQILENLSEPWKLIQEQFWNELKKER